MNSARKIEIAVKESLLHLKVMREFLTEEEISHVEQYHYQISCALGQPVGLINMHHTIPPHENDKGPMEKFPIQNLSDRLQSIVVQLLEKTSEGNSELDDYYSQKAEESESEEMTNLVDTEGKIVNNDLKKQFMTFL